MARSRPASLNRVPSAAQLETERKVLELRQAGVPYAAIAQQVGMQTAGGAKRAFDRALARTNYPQVTQARELELSRLDRVQAAHWSRALKGDDKATGRVLQVIDMRIKLLGLSHADGIAEREQRVNELQAALVAQTIRAVVEDLPLTAEQRTAALELIAARVGAITAGDEADATHPGDDEGDLEVDVDDTIPGELA